MKGREVKEWRYTEDKEKHKNVEEWDLVCVLPRQPKDNCLVKKGISPPIS